jgi:hypothetical protein
MIKQFYSGNSLLDIIYHWNDEIHPLGLSYCVSRHLEERERCKFHLVMEIDIQFDGMYFYLDQILNMTL